MGMVPVDASIDNNADRSKHNTPVMKNLISDFISGKSNIFIFPEGNNSIYKEQPMKERIQIGIAELIQKVLMFTDSVRIVPVKISYTLDKKSIGNILIRKPIVFSLNNGNIKASQNKESISIGNKDSSKIIDIISGNIS